MAKDRTVTDCLSSNKRQHTTLSELQNDQLLSHPSKVMLRVILNRLVNWAEEILEEEQDGFRSYRKTTEQIFNLKLWVEKHLEHLELFYGFMDQKKVFARVWHESL